MTSDAAKWNKIPYLFSGAKLLFVGINPHHGSFARGIPFSKNKLFWYLLSESGTLVEPREKLRDDEFLCETYRRRFGRGRGLGFINMIDQPTRDIRTLSRGEELPGRKRLFE